MDDGAGKTTENEHPGFANAAKSFVRFTGSGWALVTVLVLIGVWAAIGFATEFSRGWEVVMTAGVPILTLLMLVVVQHTQNHDNLAMQLKLDELIRALEGGQDGMIRVEDESGEHLERLERKFKAHVDAAETA